MTTSANQKRPKISGFTLLRNGVEFDYPFIESLSSLLPLVDELIVNIGIGTDSTRQKLESWRDTLPATQKQNVIFFESDWQLDNPDKKRGGLILSEQTNLALDRCTGDWCIYLQADEVFHEADRDALMASLLRAEERPEIHALVFDYVHFYGSFDVIQVSRSAYRREVRAIRRMSGARSVGDAQSFRLPSGEKPHGILAHARVFHYGWVRDPQAMRDKTFFMDQLYHGEPTAAQKASNTPHTGQNFRYKRIIGLQRFQGGHPTIMLARIERKNFHWDLEHSPLEWQIQDIKKILLNAWERYTGMRLFEYRSYRLIK